MAKKKALDRAAILSAQDLTLTPVEVPEWGGVVMVRPMTGKDRDEFESVMMLNEKQGLGVAYGLRARIVALVACDENGARLFELADVEALGAKNFFALDRIVDVAQKLNGIGGAEVEEIKENSEAGRNGDSISGSLAN